MDRSRQLFRKESFENLVGDGVSHSLHPLTATRAVILPLALDARLVSLGIAVVDPGRVRCIRCRALLHFPAEAALVDAAIAAMRTTPSERYRAFQLYNSNNFRVPTGG